MTDEGENRARNPYLILGLDYGAHEEDARRALGRTMRRVRSQPDSPYAAQDVTWALNEIQRAETDPDAALKYFRVPADAGAYERTADGSGLFSPPARRMPRTSRATSADEWEGVKQQALEELARLVLSSPGGMQALKPYEEGAVGDG